MTQNEFAIAIQIPASDSDGFQKLATEMASECTINFNAPRSKDEPSDLSFDPATGIEFAWIAMKVTGLAAEAIIAKIIAELVYKKYQERRELSLKTVRVRFPNGEVYNLVIDDPNSMKRLREIISLSAKK